MKHTIPLVSLVLLATGCTQILFSDPQPSGPDDLAAFPEYFTGTWSDEEDTIEIGDTFLRINSLKEVTFPVEDLGSSTYIYQGDSLLVIEGKDTTRYAYFTDDDTIHASRREENMILLSDSFRLRPAGRNFILNMTSNDGYWMLMRMSQTGDGMLFTMSDEQDLPLIREILGEEGTELSEYKYLFSGSFTESDMSLLIRRGGISDTLFFLHDSTRVK